MYPSGTSMFVQRILDWRHQASLWFWMTLALILISELAGNPWAEPDGWDTLHPQLNLNLDDQTSYACTMGQPTYQLRWANPLSVGFEMRIYCFYNEKFERLGGLLGWIVTISVHKIPVDATPSWRHSIWENCCQHFAFFIVLRNTDTLLL